MRRIRVAGAVERFNEHCRSPANQFTGGICKLAKYLFTDVFGVALKETVSEGPNVDGIEEDIATTCSFEPTFVAISHRVVATNGCK